MVLRRPSDPGLAGLSAQAARQNMEDLVLTQPAYPAARAAASRIRDHFKRDRTATLEAWMESAEEHPGSWWPHYAEWLAKYSAGLVPAREPGARLGVIENAPGSYVKSKA